MHAGKPTCIVIYSSFLSPPPVFLKTPENNRNRPSCHVFCLLTMLSYNSSLFSVCQTLIILVSSSSRFLYSSFVFLYPLLLTYPSTLSFASILPTFFLFLQPFFIVICARHHALSPLSPQNKQTCNLARVNCLFGKSLSFL